MAFIPSRRHGLSASPCPSLEQLMGIVDGTDPCQNGSAADTGTNTPPAPQAMGIMGYLQANPMAAVGLGLAVAIVLAPLLGNRR